MASTAPDLGVPRGIERGLLWTVGLSALAHAAIVALVIALPGRFLSVPPRIESYTVDLVAPDVVGGTNLKPGGGRNAAAAPAAAPVAPAAEPPPVSEVPVPAAPPPAAEPAAAPPPAAPVEPPKPAAEKMAEPKPPSAAEPAKAPVAKVEPKPIPKEAAPPPKPVDKVAVKSEPPPKPVTNQEAKPLPSPVAKPVAVAEKKPPPTAVVAAKKPAVSPVANVAKPAPTVDPRDQAIAAAIKQRADKMKADSDTDRRIAAAVQQRATQVEKSGGAAGVSGGPASSGPGSGVGGTPTDLQYVLYHGRMIERIKAAWAWAGSDKTLRVVVQFNITPDGEIQNIKVLEPSGNPQYDQSAERAVRAVNPLEPVPEKFRDAFATQEITFQPSDLEP